MTKSYLHSFISMKYVFIYPVLSLFIFLSAGLYMKTRIMAFRYVVFALAAVLVGILIRFYTERATISKRLAKFKDPKEYNDAYVIGQAFLVESRMLVYDRKIKEFYYKDLVRVTAEPNKHDREKLTFYTKEDKAVNVCSSLAQAQRFCAALSTRNPRIVFEGIKPMGDGTLETVESGKKERL